MKSEFIARVIREGMVDTRKYRYAHITGPDSSAIYRILLHKLDTTAALTDWELVYTIY